MGEPTDEQLMQRFCQGQDSAFEALFSRYVAKVHAFLVRMVGDAAQAEDLTQMTFLSVIRSRDRYDAGARVAPWLFSIAANAARDALRRGSVRREESLAPEHIEATTSTSRDPLLQRQLEAALAALPVAQREVVILHEVLGWKLEEIAEALDTNSTTIRVRAHRGNQKLRELLGHLREES